MLLSYLQNKHNPQNIISDENRTNYLQTKGYTVIRFWNNEIYENIDGVIEKIKEYL